MKVTEEHQFNKAWIKSEIASTVGPIPVIGTGLSTGDIVDGWKIRWNIGRMNYKIPPGLYAVGEPGAASPVLATANYKLTLDKTRKELSGLNLWLLVLDTKGINVWCAAGKGTFGTEELIHRLKEHDIGRLVSHNTIILPQLGAPGVSPLRVTAATGFKVVYGPVRAADIAAFLNNSLEATPAMRKVRFNVVDRLVLGPLELVFSLKLIPILATFLLALHLLDGSFTMPAYLKAFLPFLAAIFAGTILFPALLPWLPGRAFSIRGWILGTIIAALASIWQGGGPLVWTVNFLWLPPITAHLALRFTGSTTFTSLSGVELEVKYFYPVASVSVLTGLALALIKPF
jgi:hypothetical protein